MRFEYDMDAQLQETYLKLQHELSVAEEKLRKAHSQGKLLEADRKSLDKGIAKANNSIKVGCMADIAVRVLTECTRLGHRLQAGFACY